MLRIFLEKRCQKFASYFYKDHLREKENSCEDEVALEVCV